MKNRRWFCPRSTGELPGTCHPAKGSQGAVVLPDPWVKASGGPPPVERDEARLASSGSTCYLSPVRFGATQAPTDTLSMMSVAGGRLRGRPCSSSERAGKHVAGKHFDTLTAGATQAPTDTLYLMSVAGGRVRGSPWSSSVLAGKTHTWQTLPV